MIKMMGVAAVAHVVSPTASEADSMFSEAKSPRLFLLFGEHVQAWCSAPTMEDAERLFQENLDPFELSSTSMREVKEDEWEHFGIRRAPGDPSMPSNGEARLLACNRGDYH